MARLAKRKKKRASFGTNLKYEVYGILLITISIIALSGEAAVGRSLSKLFGFLLGIHYYMLALAGIWVGLYVMVKRTWPRGWNARRSGFIIVGLGFTLWSAMSVIDNSLGVIGAITPSTILEQTMTQLREQLWQLPTGQELSFSEKVVGGGFIGAIQYSIFFWMFGYYGAKFILIIEFAIAIMLITNRSYVEMIRTVRLFIMRVMPLLAARLSSGRKLQKAKIIPVKSQGGGLKRKDDIEPPVVATHEDEMDEPPFSPRQRKTPLFFQLFHGKADRDLQQEQDEWDEEIVAREKPREEKGNNLRDEALHTPLSEQGHVQEEVEQQNEPRFTDFYSEAYQEYDDQNMDDDGAPIPDDDELAHEAAPENLVQDEMELGQESPVQQGETSPSAPVAPKPVKKVPKPYRLPSVNLLDKPNGAGKSGNAADYMNTARKLEATLESFGVRAKVLDVARGPAVTRYELQPDVGVKVSRIVSLTDDIALALAAKDIRMEAPIPGKSAIGIEVPNNEVSIVTLREVLESTPFQESSAKLTVAFGRDISGLPIVGNLAKMPHLLVAGATGSGKSVCINGIITSLLYKAKPDEVKFLMIDPKMVELNVYNGIPHLLAPVVTDPRRASLALKKIVVEMEKRYEKFSKSGTRNIEGYNTLMMSGDNADGVLPYIVVLVDELADLMMVAAGDVEESITRLAQMARAAGIHLIIATQRPSVDVITGVIKANIPSRIAFGVSSQVDSRTILDMVGAEKLLGRGDMLFLPMGASKPIRVQGAFLSDNEVEAIVNYARGQAEAEYNEDLVPEIDDSEPSVADEVLDELFEQAVQIVIEAKHASVSLLQRRMRVGYTRAARLIDSMEAKGIVGPYEGSKPREVLMTMEQYQQRIPS
ncbi:MAG: DNA translocase FtsK [Candidatus Cohnella colombiensis]|uniref:DNA translocase FtsK n=1 Tax=Candidatus Cohnella colombiensis TaxID=3121368 RepID=A0AA95EZD4_9BACL|nr:MAG: DNA translocase FtsK [Cohnella sp.]